MKEMFL